MSDIAIRVHNLSKRYRIGAKQEPYRTLRETVMGAVSAPARRLRTLTGRAGVSTGPQEFWALNGVSFEVKRGEVVGIIGRNGAGKSTLLKILSRITEPTSGSVDIYGRVGSLLEVGTGFHPELTGRENIYLNGAILGMKRTEIDRQFDAIVEFAEVEKFVDTAVKHYSSGMYLRLAFAVAAHLDPEILLVDEVLAVGDAAFQKKCLGKMGEVAKEGRTVLFVSHDMTNIAVLCQSALMLQAGLIVHSGIAANVIDQYLNQQRRGVSSIYWQQADAPGDELARITQLCVGKQDRYQCELFLLSDAIVLGIEFVILRENVRINPVFVIKNVMGLTIFSTSNFEDPEWGERNYKAGLYYAECKIPAYILNDGQYIIKAMLVYETRIVSAMVDGELAFSVYDDGITRGNYVGEWVGIIRPRCIWSAEER